MKQIMKNKKDGTIICIRELNDKGYLINEKFFNNEEFSYEYDDDGNLIKECDSDGYEYIYKYDDNGNMTYCNDAYGEHWFEYDSDGKCIRSIHEDGTEGIYTYNDNGKLIDITYSTGFKESYEYNDKGLLIKRSDNDELSRFETHYEYYDNGKIMRTHSTDNENYDNWTLLDNNENIIYRWRSYGAEVVYVYDDNDRLISETCINTAQGTPKIEQYTYEYED